MSPPRDDGVVKLAGIYVPLTTPFDHNADLYPSKLQHNVSRLNKLGLAGYVVGGSTGESKMLSHDEKLQSFRLVKETADDGRTLVAGVGMESVKETVQLAREAADIGYQVAMVLTPHYFRGIVLKPENQLLYYRAVADQSPLPILIYNFPQNTQYDIPVEVVAQLSQHPNILGIKESSGSVGKVLDLAREVKPGFQLLVGSANTFHASLQAGATGGIFAFGNCAPYSLITIWEAFRQRDAEAAQEWQRRIAKPVVTVLNKHGIPGIKHAQDIMGYYGGPCRLPLAPLSIEAKTEIETVMADLRS
jgi:4-hydroxy-2-oxoglutarate aldolase